MWLGGAAGDTSLFCGEASYRSPSGRDEEPYVLPCGGALGDFVTLKQVGEARYLSIAELRVYTLASPAPPASTPDG